MNLYDDMECPKRIEPFPYILIAGIFLTAGALGFVSNTLEAVKHNAQHEAVNAHRIAEAAKECPQGTRITIIEGEKKTCLTEHIRTYAASRLLVTESKGEVRWTSEQQYKN